MGTLFLTRNFSLALLLALFALLPANINAAQPGTREIYLAAGGTDLLILENTTTGVVLGRSFLERYARQTANERTTRTSIRRNDEALTITLEDNGPPESPLKSKWYSQGVLVFGKSAIAPDGYDLLVDDYRHAAKGEKRGRGYQGYLYRLDDERIAQYFEIVWNTLKQSQPAIAPELLKLGQALVRDYPTEQHVRPLLWDAWLRNRMYKELSHDLEKHRLECTTNRFQWLAFAWHCADDELRAYYSSAQGQNAYDLTSRYGNGGTLSSYFTALSKVSAMREFRPYRGTIIDEIQQLELQIQAKVGSTLADFYAIEGRLDTAFELLLAEYRVGQLMNARNRGIDRLIGMALRSISLTALARLALNAEVSAPELSGWLLQFVRLADQQLPHSGVDFYDVIETPVPKFYFAERETRQLVADAKTNLTKGAIAARISHLSRRVFPASEKDFKQVLSSGIPRDPFTSAPLRWIPADVMSTYTIYSVGPDKLDQRGSVSYDPTNGTVSAGDIIQQVPAQPIYPFKRKRLTARTAADVWRAFPNGLPTDSLANSRSRSLNVSNTIPVRIFSFGPDMNQEDCRNCDPAEPASLGLPIVYLNHAPTITGCFGNPPQYVPNIPYDPTNGVVSRGDLYIDLPAQ